VKYEHKTLCLYAGMELDESLNRLSSDGWEIASATSCAVGNQALMNLILRRAAGQPTYEYKLLLWVDESDYINRFAREGWDLVSCTPLYAPGSDTGGAMLLLRREAEDAPELPDPDTGDTYDPWTNEERTVLA
jgi:hypothetical protein